MAPSSQSNELLAFTPIAAAKNALKQKLAQMQADIKSLRNNIKTLNKAEAQVKKARNASQMSKARTKPKTKITKQHRFKHFRMNPAHPTDGNRARDTQPRKSRWLPPKTQHIIDFNIKATQPKIKPCRGKPATTSDKSKVVDGVVKAPTKRARRNNRVLSTPVGPRDESLEAIPAGPKQNSKSKTDHLRRSERLKKKRG